MRVLMTGSREWSDENAMREAFKRWWVQERPANPVLISGAAEGADNLAAQIWRDSGLTVELHPAKWSEHGGCWCKDTTGRCGYAGLRRNLEMIDTGADICFAFFVNGAGNRGTKHCSEEARKAGIPVIEVWSH